MMSRDDQFVWILPKDKGPSYQSYNEYLEHNGKWIVYGGKDFIEGIGSRMVDFVGKDDILQAKLTRNPALKVPEGCEPGVYALVVYCDDRKKELVKRKLKDMLAWIKCSGNMTGRPWKKF